jgi:hypothetical protein
LQFQFNILYKMTKADEEADGMFGGQKILWKNDKYCNYKIELMFSDLFNMFQERAWARAIFIQKQYSGFAILPWWAKPFTIPIIVKTMPTN